MQPVCPACGGWMIRRARRRFYEKILSLFGEFPFYCLECGLRFHAYAGLQELALRKTLRESAAAPCLAEGVPGLDPRVLVTVQTVGHTEDLLRLMEQVDPERQAAEVAPDDEPEPPMIIIRTLGELEGGPQ